MHDAQTPISSGLASASDPYFYDQPTRTACIVYTAALGLSEPYHWRDLYPLQTFTKYYTTITPYMKVCLPRGPVAVEVCRESRKIALKRYELAFAAQNLIPGSEDQRWEKEWKEGRCGEKRIWVDFENDILFLWNPRTMVRRLYPAGAEQSVGCKIERFAALPDEYRNKIRRLALSVEWSKGGRIEEGQNAPSVFPHGRFIMRVMKYMKALEEILIVPQRTQVFVVLSEEEAQKARREVVSICEEGIASCPWKEGKIPEIAILRDPASRHREERYTVWEEQG